MSRATADRAGGVHPHRGSLLGEAEVRAVAEVLRADAPLSMGPVREEFERAFARHVGAAHALTVTSGTVALEIAIRLLDLRAGDEVVVTPQTYHATAQPLLATEATVRFCDVEPGSLNMDPDALETLVNERTKAVILVHYGGNPADMDRITAIAHAHGALVVEDCAHAIGAEYRGRRPGALGDLSCFSFQASKNITTLGEGGMVCTPSPELARRIDRIRSNAVDGTFTPSAHRRPPAALPWMAYADYAYREDCTGLRGSGTNAALSEAACAVGLVQLGRLPEFVARRRAIAAELDAVCRRFDVLPLTAAPDAVHPYHLYTALVPGDGRRDRVLDALQRSGTPAQLRYHPVHLLPEWRLRGHGEGECPVAERLWFGEHLNLPCHPAMSDRQVETLGANLAAALSGRDAPARREKEPSCP
ncbi:DegT/DnrJ/EryC1/StrS family aminotransferase [Streptomyces huiliensis]|uniref:DegT/DnrJ/EryC1/StrS family aminotransferase n=1 Tax=Streptomyces huiliensis TaxID=2876027 RepID=UPI001CBF82A3|nr:DegT/DnrJ/EryC1/StrS family aminotransferase [Streptomyces huiliensis]MBZ4320913.1 DegT/DnrJ/EryC1/StrS family aminotransferase [Streptomyces huiliensis]